MQDWIVLALLLLGSVFMLISAIGVVRLPDLYIRMHATTKGVTLCMLLIMSAVAVYFGDSWVTFEAILVILFTFLTSPLASHMISRAGYFLKVPMWNGTVIDDLDGRYDLETHTLRSTSKDRPND